MSSKTGSRTGRLAERLKRANQHRQWASSQSVTSAATSITTSTPTSLEPTKSRLMEVLEAEDKRRRSPVMDRSVASAPSRVGAGESLSQKKHYVQQRKSRMGSPRSTEGYSTISNIVPSSPTTTKYESADSPPPQTFPLSTDATFAYDSHLKVAPTRTESSADTDQQNVMSISDYWSRSIQSPPITKEKVSPTDQISPLSNQSSLNPMDSAEVWMEEGPYPQSQHSNVVVSTRAQYRGQTEQTRMIATAAKSPESKLSTSSSQQNEEQPSIKGTVHSFDSIPLTSAAPWSRESLRAKNSAPVTQSPTSAESKDAAETQEHQPPWMKDRMKLTTPSASNMPSTLNAPWSRDALRSKTPPATQHPKSWQDWQLRSSPQTVPLPLEASDTTSGLVENRSEDEVSNKKSALFDVWSQRESASRIPQTDDSRSIRGPPKQWPPVAESSPTPTRDSVKVSQWSSPKSKSSTPSGGGGPNQWQGNKSTVGPSALATAASNAPHQKSIASQEGLSVPQQQSPSVTSLWQARHQAVPQKDDGATPKQPAWKKPVATPESITEDGMKQQPWKKSVVALESMTGVEGKQPSWKKPVVEQEPTKENEVKLPAWKKSLVARESMEGDEVKQPAWNKAVVAQEPTKEDEMKKPAWKKTVVSSISTKAVATQPSWKNKGRESETASEALEQKEGSVVSAKGLESKSPSWKKSMPTQELGTEQRPKSPARHWPPPQQLTPSRQVTAVSASRAGFVNNSPARSPQPSPWVRKTATQPPPESKQNQPPWRTSGPVEAPAPESRASPGPSEVPLTNDRVVIETPMPVNIASLRASFGETPKTNGPSATTGNAPLRTPNAAPAAWSANRATKPTEASGDSNRGLPHKALVGVWHGNAAPSTPNTGLPKWAATRLADHESLRAASALSTTPNNIPATWAVNNVPSPSDVSGRSSPSKSHHGLFLSAGVGSSTSPKVEHSLKSRTALSAVRTTPSPVSPSQTWIRKVNTPQSAHPTESAVLPLPSKSSPTSQNPSWGSRLSPYSQQNNFQEALSRDASQKWNPPPFSVALPGAPESATKSLARMAADSVLITDYEQIQFRDSADESIDDSDSKSASATPKKWDVPMQFQSILDQSQTLEHAYSMESDPSSIGFPSSVGGSESAFPRGNLLLTSPDSIGNHHSPQKVQYDNSASMPRLQFSDHQYGSPIQPSPVDDDANLNEVPFTPRGRVQQQLHSANLNHVGGTYVSKPVESEAGSSTVSSAIFGDPNSFGAAGGDEIMVGALPVSERAKAIEAWSAGKSPTTRAPPVLRESYRGQGMIRDDLDKKSVRFNEVLTDVLILQADVNGQLKTENSPAMAERNSIIHEGQDAPIVAEFSESPKRSPRDVASILRFFQNTDPEDVDQDHWGNQDPDDLVAIQDDDSITSSTAATLPAENLSAFTNQHSPTASSTSPSLFASPSQGTPPNDELMHIPSESRSSPSSSPRRSPGETSAFSVPTSSWPREKDPLTNAAPFVGIVSSSPTSKGVFDPFVIDDDDSFLNFETNSFASPSKVKIKPPRRNMSSRSRRQEEAKQLSYDDDYYSSRVAAAAAAANHYDPYGDGN